jgi:hypothetical protein
MLFKTQFKNNSYLAFSDSVKALPVALEFLHVY